MNFTFREYSLFGLALLAAVWFFAGYPSQDPRSAIDLSVDEVEIRKNAEQMMDNLGYAADQFEPDIHFTNNRKLLDTLQYSVGRPELTRQLQEGAGNKLHAFYWEVGFHLYSRYRSSRSIEEETNDSPGPPDENREAVRFRFDEEGNLMELLNPYPILPIRMVNRTALAAVFINQKHKQRAQKWMNALPDSLLAQKMRVDEKQKGNSSQLFSTAIPDDENGAAILRLAKEDFLLISEYYLEKTGWDKSAMRADTVLFEHFDRQETITIRYRSERKDMVPPHEIEVQMLPGGGLLSLASKYELKEEASGGAGELWPLLRIALIFLFGMAGIVIFFFRIRARAVDTKPALIIGILGGVAISVTILLSSLADINYLTNPNYLTGSIVLMIVAGLAGAAASLAFFVFAAIGDSITRQYWIEKLSVTDYLRQGMLYNQPIGMMIIRSVLSAFILAGIWTLAFWALPNLFIDIEQVFLHGNVLWPPLYLLLDNSGMALGVVLGIFLVLGSQVYALTQSRTASFVMMILAFTVVAPVAGSYGPVLAEVILAAVIGTALALIYLQWDAVTLLLSFFLFLGLAATVPGWIVSGSVDFYVFIFFLILMGTLLLVGFWAIGRGRAEQALTPFIPEYVEELAQEERIKQELQIAREVQQSFLPVQMPEYGQLELAAMCTPAHETGGDYYDIIPLDDNRIAVTIGDVSGKGIQAAFYMTFVKGVLHSLCREVESPAEVLKKANQLFYKNAPRGVFISLIYGIIDLEKREFYFARAGHNPILHLNNIPGKITELQPKGIGIGLDDGRYFDHNIEEVSLQLYPKDMLVLYTDGIVEALNPNHVFYGTHRLNNLLSKNKDRSAAAMLQVFSDDVHRYVGEAKQHDDMTMVIIKMKGDS